MNAVLGTVQGRKLLEVISPNARFLKILPGIRSVVAYGGWVGAGIEWETGIDIYILLYVRVDN